MSIKINRFLVYFLFMTLLTFIFIVYEYCRSIMLFFFINAFLDYKNYTYLALLIITQFLLSMFILGLLPDLYVIMSMYGRYRCRTLQLVIKAFTNNYGTYLVFLFIPITIGIILAYTTPQIFIGGYPTSFVFTLTLYIVILYLYGIILLLVHYGVTPFMYANKDSKFIIGYVKFIAQIIRNLKKYVFYIILGSIITLLLTFIIGNILYRYIGEVLSVKIYYDTYMFKYIHTRPRLIEYADKYVSTVGSIVQDIIYSAILYFWYKRYVKSLNIVSS